MSKKLYLVCNAHLDPVWLWEWEEGAAEALSTFRAAAELSETFEEFVFNHNEAVLYRWVEAFEPELFSRIQKLVKKRKWHIMGGWYLQPDCNMPSGESLCRQILIGRQYFRNRFGEEPETACNFDSFGHSRGLVQVLKKSGYSSYLFCRPDAGHLSLPADDFIWVGYDGSEIMAHRATHHYNSQRGKSRERVERWLEENADRASGLLLWGIGNHGGGASREDLQHLRQLIKESKAREVRHSVPEEYFKALKKVEDQLPRHTGDINPWAVGCYTTMARIKEKHRRLENSFYFTEKMVTHASLEGLVEYPGKELQGALEDLLFCEFHDILPGSSIAEVEASALQRMDHGLEILSRLKAKAFFALLSGEARAGEAEFPVFVYNPHPYPLRETVVCELQPQEPSLDPESFQMPEITDSKGTPLPLQLEKESSNISVDQRKRVVFTAELKPGQMNRFSCRLKEVPARAVGFERYEEEQTRFVFQSGDMEVVIDEETGLVGRFRVNGVDFLQPGSFRPLVIEDYPDPWGMKVRAFRNVLGSFTLMSGKEAARFAGVLRPTLRPVRIIEDGPVRTVVEALLTYNHSFICQRYKIPKIGSELEVETRVFWSEKDRMLKLSMPTVFSNGVCKGQVAYGTEDFSRTAEELVAQKWIGVFSPEQNLGLTIINERTYGFDFAQGEIRLSLLRSAAYAAHPVEEGRPILPQDRFEPRVDQGERLFRFWVSAGEVEARLLQVDREALVRNERPMVLSCFPSGKGKKPRPSLSLSGEAVQVTAINFAEKKNWLVLRFFEPTGKKREARVNMPLLDLSFALPLNGFEIKTMAVDLETHEVFEVDLMERRLQRE